MRSADLSGMFRDKRWKRLSKKLNEAQGFNPNWVYFDEERAAVVVKQSSSGDDYAMSLTALQYLENSQKEGRRRKCYVVLVDRQGNYVAEETVYNVRRNLSNSEPLFGPYGRYFWLTQDFQDATLSHLDEMPF